MGYSLVYVSGSWLVTISNLLGRVFFNEVTLICFTKKKLTTRGQGERDAWGRSFRIFCDACNLMGAHLLFVCVCHKVFIMCVSCVKIEFLVPTHLMICRNSWWIIDISDKKTTWIWLPNSTHREYFLGSIKPNGNCN